MDDLISREEYKKVIDEQLRFYNPDSSPWHVKILELQRELLDSMPAVDAVLVVRCRDCKYYAINRLTKAYEPDKRFNPSVCIIGEFARPRKPDWYCAGGERRDDE